jgi:Tol biopolymer transport system component
MTPGKKIGGYEIVSLIGAGGMGEVYRARDMKLKRDVALKVLPDAFANDPVRMARFQREAEMLASLNHPNIAHIYGVEEHALVMELAEGDSPKGPLPFEDAWKIALQIADALEYAHEKGVIHRDLKPANVKVTPDGVVKLLDFGLAKVFSDTPDLFNADSENSPTVTLGGTVAGTVLGTAAYMSPEQAKGKRVDKRADIWSWGVVLYELLTGERLFQGDEAADTLAAVIHKQPDLERVPVKVRRLLGACLKKDPKLRLRDIGDAEQLLAEETVTAPWQPRLGIIFAVTALLLVAFAALGFVAWNYFRLVPPPIVKYSFPPPENGIFPQAFPTMQVSPDGRHIAFQVVARGKWELWIRDLDSSSPRMLTVVENRPEQPFWAPDNHRLGFFDGDKLKKVDITGGPAVAIADTGGNRIRSGSWNRDDVIVFASPNTPVFRVPAAGGSPEPLTELDKDRDETGHWAPWFLPDGRHFLYVALTGSPEKSAVYVGDLNSKGRRQVVSFGSRAIYVNPGYLLYLRERTLVAQPFDAGKLKITGGPEPVADLLDFNQAGAVLGHFSASQNGVLVYTAGGVGNIQLTWFDPAGTKLGAVGEPGDIQRFSISPDGHTVALTRGDPQTGRYDIWMHDLEHDSESPLTTTGDNRSPVWSYEGTYIYFSSNHDGGYKIYRKAADNAGREELVEASDKIPTDASRDGRYLLGSTPLTNPKTSNDIWMLPLFGDRKASPYVATAANEVWPRVSPDSRWLAYQSNESKRPEIYVTTFPQPGPKRPISTKGGQVPAWSRNGRELYYYSADGEIMAVEIKPGKGFQFGLPKAVFPVRMTTNNAGIEVSSDGRFLLPVLVEQASAPMTVVLNWPELLTKR